MTELLAIGDGLPPSAMGLMDVAGPVSSMKGSGAVLANGLLTCQPQLT